MIYTAPGNATLRVCFRAPDVTVEGFAIADVVYATSTSVRLDLKLYEAGRRAGIPESVFLATVPEDGMSPSEWTRR